MILVPTRKCNTDTCGYCGVLKTDSGNLYFQDANETEVYARLLLLAEKTGDFELRFFGGEPLLQFDKMKRLIQYISYRDTAVTPADAGIDNIVQNKPINRSPEQVRGGHKGKRLFSFVINTNLSLLKDDWIQFFLEYDVKLIISCNGDLYSHCQTRGVVKEVTLKLYENIQRIISAGIAYQINIVSTPDVVARLHKNFVFLHEKLGGKVFNFLPVNYNGWDDASLAILESELEQVWQDMQRGGKLQDIQFINGEVDNRVALFNAELVVDSDGRVYPSMVILEKFFLEEKENICIADMREDIEAFESKLSAFDTENFSVYDAYINKVLQKKFASIQQNDYRSSEIFHEFLERIGK